MIPFFKACKSYKCTANEATFALLSITLKEYFKNRGDTTTEKISFTSTFSRKGLAKSIDEVKCSNDWVPLTYPFYLRDTIEEALIAVKQNSQDLVGSRFIVAA